MRDVDPSIQGLAFQKEDPILERAVDFWMAYGFAILNNSYEGAQDETLDRLYFQGDDDALER